MGKLPQRRIMAHTVLLAEQLYRMQHRQLPEGWDKDLPNFPADAKGLATRDSSAKVLNALEGMHEKLVGTRTNYQTTEDTNTSTVNRINSLLNG